MKTDQESLARMRKAFKATVHRIRRAAYRTKSLIAYSSADPQYVRKGR